MRRAGQASIAKQALMERGAMAPQCLGIPREARDAVPDGSSVELMKIISCVPEDSEATLQGAAVKLPVGRLQTTVGADPGTVQPSGNGRKYNGAHNTFAPRAHKRSSQNMRVHMHTHA